jgi:hypothetical protein
MSTYGVEAQFGEKAQNEWAKALNEWVKLGEHVFMSHNEIERNGKLVKDPIKLDDSTNPERFNQLLENQRYWTSRWADQMNYRYWKERCMAEKTALGVLARQYFYDGTVAYKTGDFPKAAEKFEQGLKTWKAVLEEFSGYRDDDLNKKDTGLIVKRYIRVLKQLGTPVPENLPFKELLPLVENDTTVDPFDVLEMIGVPGEIKTQGPGTTPPGERTLGTGAPVRKAGPN